VHDDFSGEAVPKFGRRWIPCNYFRKPLIPELFKRRLIGHVLLSRRSGILFPGNDIRYYHRSPQDELGLALATSRL
jgi:hypothetical protein